MPIVSRNIYLKRFFLALIFIIILVVGLELFAPDASAEPGKPKAQTSLKYNAPFKLERSDQTTTTTTTTTTTKPLVKRADAQIPQTVATVPSLPPASNMTHNEIMAAAGIAEEFWDDAEYIIAGENATWNPCMYYGQKVDCNYQGNGAYGIPQAIGGGRKMANAGADWRTSAVTQLRWMEMYCNGEKYPNAHYKSWAAAVAYKRNNGVY